MSNEMRSGSTQPFLPTEISKVDRWDARISSLVSPIPVFDRRGDDPEVLAGNQTQLNDAYFALNDRLGLLGGEFSKTLVHNAVTARLCGKNEVVVQARSGIQGRYTTYSLALDVDGNAKHEYFDGVCGAASEGGPKTAQLQIPTRAARLVLEMINSTSVK